MRLAPELLYGSFVRFVLLRVVFYVAPEGVGHRRDLAGDPVQAAV